MASSSIQAFCRPAVLGTIAWLLSTPMASAQDLSQLIAKVKPSVVQVKLPGGSTGSGFIVAREGIVATNYHVIEGAKSAVIVFPGTDDKKEYPVVGYVGIAPGKDLALIYFNPEGKTLVPLPFAAKIPVQGEAVVTFGAPRGFSDTVSQGIVSSVRTGEQLRDMMKHGNYDGYGKDGLGYDTNLTWLQTTAPISGGNSGGPLVNMKGEVVGVNTWCRTDGQNLNFSLSAFHVRDFLASLGTKLQPQSFAGLPKPRRKHAGPMTGDYAKTRAAWITLNNGLNEVNEKVAAAEKKLRQITPIDPRNLLRGQNVRIKKKAAAFEVMEKAYKDYLGKIKSLDTRDFDPDLIMMLLKETSIVQATADTCHEIANQTGAQATDGDSIWENKLSLMKQLWTEQQSKREALRVVLCHKYNKQFPTPEETARNGGVDTEETAPAKKDESKEDGAGKKPKVDEDDANDDPDMRLWTDKTGKHKIRAKFVGIEDGTVKLRRSNGKLIRVPLDSLSEADRKFLGEE